MSPNKYASGQSFVAGARLTPPVRVQSDVKRDLITATAGVSLVASFLMGVGANLPVAAAPGMGLNVGPLP